MAVFIFFRRGGWARG